MSAVGTAAFLEAAHRLRAEGAAVELPEDPEARAAVLEVLRQIDAVLAEEPSGEIRLVPV